MEPQEAWQIEGKHKKSELLVRSAVVTAYMSLLRPFQNLTEEENAA